MSGNTYGRQLAISLTNKTGGGVVKGDVVVLDGSNNGAFTTTTSAATTAVVGIVQETIANNADGRVLLHGYADLVNVNASVTRGHFGATHTVAKQAADAGTSRTAGTFCFFLTGGTTPTAAVFNPDLGGAALTNPMTTKGDMIQADTGGTPVRTAAGALGSVWTAGGAGAFSGWAAHPSPGQSYGYPTAFAGDVINGSSTTPFVDVSAFDVKEVLNSRVLHLKTLGASHDHRVRVTLGTTKAGAFDVTTCVAFFGSRWTFGASANTYLEVRLSTSADAQLAIWRLYPIHIDVPSGDAPNLAQLLTAARAGGSSIAADNFLYEPVASLGGAITLRMVRDGSNVITFSAGVGTMPMALQPILVQSDYSLYSTTVSGTLARVEYSIHTPSGPAGGTQYDAFVDYLASV